MPALQRRGRLPCPTAAGPPRPVPTARRETMMPSPASAPTSASAERSLLIVDDDAPFCQRLAQAMGRRGYAVVAAESVAAGIRAAGTQRPAFAVVDLRLADGNGLEVVPAIRSARPDARIVVLTGYGNIASAVAAVKHGALDYLSKPADADAVEAALLQLGAA